MTPVVLISAVPRNAATGAGVTVRLAGGGNRKPYLYGGHQYRAGVATLPRFKAEIAFDESGWTGGVRPTTGTIIWAPAGKAALAELAAYVWKGATVTVEEGDEETGTFATRLTGKVADAAIQDHKLVITVADLGADLDKPLVTARFAGTGGAEGGTEAAGRIKRRTWGRAFNIEGRILDKANNIYEFGDPAFPWQSFETLRDKGRAADPAPAVIAWAGSVAATLAALVASSPAQGSCAVAPSIACCKWWTQPAGPLTADVKGEIGTGYVETAPSIAERILTAAAGPTITNVATANGWRAGVAGIHVAEDETIASAIDRLAMGISLIWILDPAGTVTFREITFTGPIETLRSDTVNRQRTFRPTRSRRVGYQKGYRTHSDGEIAATLLQLDAEAAAELTAATAAALAAGDDGIWTAQEKISTIIPAVQALEDRYTELTLRAAALGVSTTDVSTLRTSFHTYLGNQAPAWNDVDQDTTIVVNVSDSWPTGWSGTAGIAADGLDWTLTDNSAAASQNIARTFTVSPSAPYTLAILIEKDAVPASTRFAVLRFQTQNGTSKNATARFNTQLGTVISQTADVYSADMVDYSSTHWLAVVTVILNANNSSMSALIYPAAGTTATDTVVAQGSITVSAPVVALGDVTNVGRYAWRYYLRAYEWGLQQLQIAINEASVVEATSVLSGLSDIVIGYDHTGAAQDGQLTRNEVYRLVRDSATVTTGLTWTYTVVNGSINGFTSASGAQGIGGAGGVTFAITAFATAEATVQIKAVDANGVPYVKTVRILRNTANAPVTSSAGGGTAASVSSFASFTSTSMATVMPTGVAELVVVAGGTSVALTASLSTGSNATANTVSEVYAIFQWWNGSAWADVGTEVASNPDVEREQLSEPTIWVNKTRGQISINTSKTGLTAGTTNRFRLMMRRHASSASGTYSTTGTAGAQG